MQNITCVWDCSFKNFRPRICKRFMQNITSVWDCSFKNVRCSLFTNGISSVTTAYRKPCSGKESSSAGPLRRSSSPTQTTSASGSLLIRKAVQAQGIQGRTYEIICVSWRESTERQYASYLSRWNQSCTSRNSDPLRPAVALVLEFLTKLFNKKRACSAFNTARSAIPAVTQTAIGSHP